MDKPSPDTLVPQRRGAGRWPVTLTTERANPLRRWNPGWGGCPAARRPVAAVNVFSLRRPVFVKRSTHEMTPREVPAVRRGRPGAPQPTEPRSRAQPGCATRIGRDLTAYAATGDRPRTRSHSRSSGSPNRRKRAHRMMASTRSSVDAYSTGCEVLLRRSPYVAGVSYACRFPVAVVNHDDRLRGAVADEVCRLAHIAAVRLPGGPPG